MIMSQYLGRQTDASPPARLKVVNQSRCAGVTCPLSVFTSRYMMRSLTKTKSGKPGVEPRLSRVW